MTICLPLGTNAVRFAWAALSIIRSTSLSGSDSNIFLHYRALSFEGGQDNRTSTRREQA
jgi:hypothetical protein